CPGPNTAYFSSIATLRMMVDHIYGRISLLNTEERPHMFIKELSLYMDYLKREIETTIDFNAKRMRYIETFRSNLLSGIAYYEELFPQLRSLGENILDRSKKELQRF